MTAATTLQGIRPVVPAETALRTVRVTHVVFDFDGGGLETLVAEMAAGFRGTSVHVSLVTLSGREGRLGASTRERFESFNIVRPLPIVSMTWPVGVAATIRSTKPDVVHLHTGAWYKGARAARLAGVKRVVYTEHGREHWDPPLMRWLDRRASMRTDAVVSVSTRLGKYLAREVGVAQAKICTIHNGIDTAAFTPGAASDDLRRSLDIPSDALVLGSVGRLESVKSYERLLEAAALLRTQWQQPFVVALFGDGSQRQPLQQRAEQLGVSDLVRFAGWTDRAIDAYRLMDIFVLPSRSEGQSVSLLEALACGAVPVVTDVGANRETLGPELATQLVSPENPEAIASTLLATVKSPQRMHAMAACGRARVAEHYSHGKMLREYESLYRRLSSTRARSR